MPSIHTPDPGSTAGPKPGAPVCTVCGSTTFLNRPVLWERLISEWQLSPDETAYINHQQGTCCTACGSNLRSMALASALQVITHSTVPLRDLVTQTLFQSLRVLEINEAGNLTPYLRCLKGYTFGAFPQVDMHDMPYASDTFDVVVHSDTLEHVEQPLRALAECHRVLQPGGVLCFTVPIIVGRMSRNRNGLPKSYHGNEQTCPDDFLVHTEFGADAWTFPLQAGFRRIEMVAPVYPSAIAMVARKEPAV